ncbi:hypothetical protein CFC21_043172 [Triticum aestivum]|uniref:Uncharacterized protein n=2 Tax=Triticum aestivum TaxID=4565 RepID=A0A9R1JWA4_WHEAT|nr:hypothetical protein CFC21_043172 [Triticum aestivum]CDM81843.1 unnamed protein product [Triticum aestivum]
MAVTAPPAELFNAAAGAYHGSSKVYALLTGCNSGGDLGGGGGAASRERRRRRPPLQWSCSKPRHGPTMAPARCLRGGLPRRRNFLWHVDKVGFYLGAIFGNVEMGIVVAMLISLLRVLLFVARPRTAVMGNVPETTIYRRMDQYTTCSCCVWNRPSTSPTTATCARGSPGGLTTTTNRPHPRHGWYTTTWSEILPTADHLKQSMYETCLSGHSNRQHRHRWYEYAFRHGKFCVEDGNLENLNFSLQPNLDSSFPHGNFFSSIRHLGHLQFVYDVSAAGYEFPSVFVSSHCALLQHFL